MHLNYCLPKGDCSIDLLKKAQVWKQRTDFFLDLVTNSFEVLRSVRRNYMWILGLDPLTWFVLLSGIKAWLLFSFWVWLPSWGTLVSKNKHGCRKRCHMLWLHSHFYLFWVYTATFLNQEWHRVSSVSYNPIKSYKILFLALSYKIL